MPTLVRRACAGLGLGLLITFLLHAVPAAAEPHTQNADGYSVYLPLATRSPDAPTIHPFVQRVVELTNAERARHGCAPLSLSPTLNQAADQHSRDMAINDRFSHIGSDGSTMQSRILAAGYSKALAENIAAGYSTADAVFAAWMGSEGHRDNIRNCALREIGVGFYDQPDDQANVRSDSGNLGGPYRFYWTQDFGTP